jgi:small ligand-binding sensory domain FIST
MKWASSIAEGLAPDLALQRCISEILEALGPGPIDLVFVFVSPHYQKSYEAIPAQVMKGLSCGVLIGCTAAGIIGDGKEIEQKAAISLTAARLPGVSLKPFHAGMDQLPTLDASPKTWRDWAGFSSDQTPHFVLFADPFSFNPESLFMGLDFAFPHSSKVGGLASGAVRPGENVLFLKETAYRNGLVGLSLEGNLVVDTVVAQGCRPIGYPMHITQCDQNLLLSLDRQKPIDILKELLESLSEDDRELAQHSLFLGMVMDPLKEDLKQGDFLIRNIRFEPLNGVLAVGADLREGQTVQFHLRDSKTSAEDLDLMLTRHLMEHNPSASQGALLFSCLGRGQHLYGYPNHDSDLFRQKMGPIPLGGFFCNGEIGAVGPSTYLHGYTSCFGIFRPTQNVQ